MKANNNAQEQLLLEIIKVAKEQYHIRYFHKIEYRNSNFQLQSLINKFNTNCVYSTKAYEKQRNLYQKDIISLEELKNSTLTIMKEIAKSFENDTINDFFKIINKKELPKMKKTYSFR
ncbi:MAG: hypothetical protein M9958_00975 [Chitinophagales bacterium]|nr:hypothetical protein [Chitinophagales bacterium]